MSSIEERLARDIAAVIGGVVVTESDLRDARDALDERVAGRRHWDRRRTVVAAAAAAVLILILGVTAFLTLGGDDKAVPPAGPAPTPSTDSHAEFLSGSAPTSDLLDGVWRLDNGGVLMRFAAPDLVSFDRSGRLFEAPGVQGTYAIDGDLITITVDGGLAGCGGQQIAMRASVPKQGALHLVYTEPGAGSCATLEDERWVMEQVLPTSPIMAELVYSAEKGWQPLASEAALHGSWLAEGGGHVLEIDPGGSYYVADESAKPIDRGRWSLRGSDLTLTSSAGAAECSEGDQLVLGTVEQVAGPGTTAMRSTVQKNACGAAWADAVWILIPHDATN